MAETKQYVIVRELPGVGSFSQEQLAGASDTSNKAIVQVRSFSHACHAHVISAGGAPMAVGCSIRMLRGAAFDIAKCILHTAAGAWCKVAAQLRGG